MTHGGDGDGEGKRTVNAGVVGLAVGMALGFAGYFGGFGAFLLVGATHSLVRRLRQSPWTAAFLDGINAASVALMAGVLYQLAASFLGLRLDAWLIFAAAAAAIFRFRINSAWVVLAGALVGLLLYR